MLKWIHALHRTNIPTLHLRSTSTPIKTNLLRRRPPLNIATNAATMLLNRPSYIYLSKVKNTVKAPPTIRPTNKLQHLALSQQLIPTSFLTLQPYHQFHSPNIRYLVLPSATNTINTSPSREAPALTSTLKKNSPRRCCATLFHQAFTPPNLHTIKPSHLQL